jgi:hypothetical protein
VIGSLTLSTRRRKDAEKYAEKNKKSKPESAEGAETRERTRVDERWRELQGVSSRWFGRKGTKEHGDNANIFPQDQ